MAGSCIIAFSPATYSVAKLEHVLCRWLEKKGDAREIERRRRRRKKAGVSVGGKKTERSVAVAEGKGERGEKMVRRGRCRGFDSS